MMTLMALFWLALITVLLVRLGWQYWTYPEMSSATIEYRSDHPLISVIIPARNEETNIGVCLEHIQDQTYPTDRYEIIVVDDNSTDKTAAIAEKCVLKHIQLLPAGQIMDGWQGKQNACHVGAQRAHGEMLLFLDADTFAGPKMLECCQRTMDEQKCDLLSFTPHEEVAGFWERALMPWGFVLLSLSFNFLRVNDPNRSEAIANGQCMMFRRYCYDAIGGHAAVRDQVLEDIALAHLVKQQGFRLFFARGENLARTRMYRHLTDLRHGLRRIIRRILQKRSVALSHVLVAMLLAISPLAVPGTLLMLAGKATTLAFAIAVWASLSFFGMAAWICNYFRIPLSWALLAPLGFGLWGIIVLDAAVLGKRRPLSWKNRTIVE